MTTTSESSARTIGVPQRRRASSEVLIGRLLWAGLLAVLLFVGT